MKITDVKTFLMHVGQPDRTKWASDGHSGNLDRKGDGTVGVSRGSCIAPVQSCES